MYKVCHITSAHQRYDIRIFQKECTSLAKYGYKVYLVVNDDKPNEVINNVSIVSSNYVPKSRLKRFFLSPIKIYKKAIEINADIYCFHDPELLGIGLKLKKKGKNVIFDCHEFYKEQIYYEKEYIPKYLRRIIAYLYNTYETYVVSKLDAVLVPTTFAGKNIFENRAKETVYINNLPKLEEFYNHYEENKQDNNSEYTVCHVGSLSYVRGISHLIKAANKAGVKAILGGSFNSIQFENEVKKMSEYKVVDYKGYVNRDDVLSIYKNSDIGICTILNVGQNCLLDNFATKVYEYMSMGLPVIISDYPYSRKVMDQNKFGILVDPEDIDQIEKAITYLKENPNVAKEMGKCGRNLIKDEFNWSNEEVKLINLYNCILNNKSNRKS